MTTQWTMKTITTTSLTEKYQTPSERRYPCLSTTALHSMDQKLNTDIQYSSVKHLLFLPEHHDSPTHDHNLPPNTIYERCVRSDVYESNALSSPKLRLQLQNQQQRQSFRITPVYAVLRATLPVLLSLPLLGKRKLETQRSGTSRPTRKRKTATQNYIHQSLYDTIAFRIL